MLELAKIEGLKNNLFLDYDSLTKEEIRLAIADLENKIATTEIEGRVVFYGNSDICPLKHSFSEGLYIREIFIPKGTLVIGKIHKNEHPSFLGQGKVMVLSEEKKSELVSAPQTIITSAGIKKVVYAIEDTIWINVIPNPTNSKDIEFLEEQDMTTSYIEYKEYVNNKNTFISKLKKLIIKNLSE